MLYVLKSWSFEIWTAELLINVVWVMWRFASYYQLSKKDQLQSWSPSSWSSCSGCQPVQFWVLENHLMMHNLHFLSCVFASIPPHSFTVQLWQETDPTFSISSLQPVDDRDFITEIAIFQHLQTRNWKGHLFYTEACSYVITSVFQASIFYKKSLIITKGSFSVFCCKNYLTEITTSLENEISEIFFLNRSI